MRYITPNGGIGGWVSLSVHVKGPGISAVLQPGTLRWLEKTHRPIEKVLPVSGQWSMRQLALRARVKQNIQRRAMIPEPLFTGINAKCRQQRYQIYKAESTDVNESDMV
ncbi:hypothetical protein TNCV_3515071 [Trichonephila clavipes]|nr:hypothetical protein TNCV_3515071 [Trichonephila clavipes]